MKNSNLQQQIALTLLPGMGYKRVRTILQHTGSIEEFFRWKKKQFLEIPGIGKNLVHQMDRKQALEDAAKHLEFLDKNQIQSYFYLEEDYPRRLNQCEDAPLLLFGKGNCSFNDTKTVAIVGTRNATAYGRAICEELIASFQGKNIVVVSGLAYGIDIIAHELCLKYDVPTIGVLGHGLDRIYPAAHRKTAVKMLENGGLLTEFLAGTNPDRENFPMRNRIVAGMCDATIVVESGLKGGSLITAELANDYNRDVFAFPGDITKPFSAGCNRMIQSNKAQLITESADFFRYMNWEEKKEKSVQAKLFVDLNPVEQSLVDLLNQEDAIPLDILAIKSNMPTSKASVTLLNLEFQGVVRSLPGQRYALIR